MQTYFNHKYCGLFSEACLKMIKLPPSFQKDTFKTHPLLKLIRCLLFSKLKHWGISKSDLIILYLKKQILVHVVFLSINSITLVAQNYEKDVTHFDKYVLLKKVAVPTSKRYIFWIITYSGENKLLWNNSFAEKVFIFNKELIKKSICYWEVVIWRK